LDKNEVGAMASELRKTGIGIVGDMPWGTHFCHFYETKQDLLDTLVPYFKAGLESKEYCLWVVSDSELITVEEAKEALAQAIPDLDRHLSDENIEILNGHDWYFEKNVLNLEIVASAWDAKVKRALARGYDGLRASADTFWLREKDWKDFCAYEKQVNDWITNQRMTVLCTYPLSKSGAAEVLDVAQTHQFAIARRQGEWEVFESLELRQARAEIKRLNEALQRVKERTLKQPLILSYGVAVLSVIAALIITLWLRMELGQQSTPIVGLFLCAIMFSAWFGGFWPGVLAIALSLLTFVYYFETPFYSLAVDIKEIPRLLIFALSALFVGSLSAAQRSKAESLRRARDTLDGAVQELKQTNVALRAEIAERKRAEALLHVKEQEFRAIVENTPDQIARYDRSFRRTYVNPAFAKSLNLPAEALIGKPMFSIIRDTGLDVEEDELAQVRQRFEDVFDTGNSCEFEVTVPMPAGQRYFGVRFFPELDLNGSVINVLGIARDITERKQAEEALKESQRRLEEAQRIAHVGHWERELKTGLITWSDEIYRILGLPLPENDSPPKEWRHMIHPEDRERVSLVIEEAQRGVRRYDVEYRIVRPDGEVRFLHSQGDIIRDEQGRPVRAFGIVQGITERKRAEEALRQAEETYHSIFEHAIEGIFQTTPDGQYITTNPALARMLGYDSPEELISNRTDIERQQYVKPERRAEFKRLLEEHGVVRNFEYEAYRKDGHKIWLSDNVRAVRDESGAILYYEGSTEDITEHKQAGERLRATTEQLRALSARIHSAKEEEGTRIAREIHDELGAALTSLRWDLENIDKVISESGDQMQLQALREKIDGMMGLIDTTISAVRRISSELRPGVLDDLGLVEAIEWQAQQFQARTGIICRCDYSLEHLNLNQEQSTAVFRIFQEALTNILRHAQATSVDITIKAEAGEFVLAISDNGRGITESEKSGSQSLGLLGMHERAHLIGGKFNINGEGGKGTVITVQVPMSG
jgi:PAS domain S-box-containing protein